MGMEGTGLHRSYRTHNPHPKPRSKGSLDSIAGQLPVQVASRYQCRTRAVLRGEGSRFTIPGGNSPNGASRWLSLDRHIEHLRSPQGGRTSRNNSLVWDPEHSRFTKWL